MKVYPSKTIPGKMVHLPESLDDLRTICLNHGYLDDTRILLNANLYSSKSLSYTPGAKFAWEVYHAIDGSLKKYTEKTLERDTNIVKAIEKRAFIIGTNTKEKCSCNKI